MNYYLKHISYFDKKDIFTKWCGLLKKQYLPQRTMNKAHIDIILKPEK